MKIIVVIRSLTRGGAERVVCRLTTEWARSHSVSIALFDATDQAFHYGGRLVDLGLPAESSVAKKAARVLARARRLARLLLKEQPDRIVSFMETANFPTIVAAAVTGCLGKLYISVRNNPSSIPFHYRILIPLFYRIPERIVVPSQGIKAHLSEMGVPEPKLLFIPNPMVKHAPCESGQAPFPFPYVLGAGRLHRKKGFDRLMRAFSMMLISDLHLVILGAGEERGALISLSEKLKIRSRTHFPGPVSNIEDWYRHAECFVLSSRHEGWPNVLMEAMATGCPVVSYDCPYGPSEIVEDGKTGLLVAQGDIKGLAIAIKRILADQSLRRRLAKYGERRGRMFAVERIAPLWLA